MIICHCTERPCRPCFRRLSDRVAALEAQRATLLSALTRACKQVDGPARAALEQIARELSNG